MTVLRERQGQALVRYDISTDSGSKLDARYEWWFNTDKMREGIKLEEKNGRTQIYCFDFIGDYREYWLTEQFDRRLSLALPFREAI